MVNTDNEFTIRPVDCAKILRRKKLGQKQICAYLSDIWELNQQMISENTKKEFMSKSLYWLDYFNEKETTDEEIKRTSIEANRSGKEFNADDYIAESDELNLLLKKIRLELTVEKKTFCRFKMETFMSDLGKKRKSARMKQCFEESLEAYELEASLRGGEPAVFDALKKADTVMIKLKEKEEITARAEWNERACILLVNPPDDPADLDDKNRESDRMVLSRGIKDNLIIWPVDPQAMIGDVVLFFCPKNTATEAKYLLDETVERWKERFVKKAKEELDFYERNHGLVIAAGVITEDPKKTEGWYVKISDLIWLKNPIELTYSNIKVSILRTQPATYISCDEWLELRKKIRYENPEIRL